MSKDTDLFLQILTEVSEGKLRLNPTDTIAAIFEQGLQAVEFELALYSLEATTHREIAQDFYEGAIDDHWEKSISDFLGQYLSKSRESDTMFVTKVFKKFYQSTQWHQQEQNESGSN